MAPSVKDCVVEAEKEPLLGGGVAILEVVPWEGDLDEGEALGTEGGGEGVTSIEVAPLEDSSGDLICKGAALGTGGRVGVAIMEVIPSEGIVEGESLGARGVSVAITDRVVTMGK